MSLKNAMTTISDELGITKTLELVLIFMAAGCVATAIANPLIPNKSNNISKGED